MYRKKKYEYCYVPRRTSAETMDRHCTRAPHTSSTLLLNEKKAIGQNPYTYVHCVYTHIQLFRRKKKGNKSKTSDPCSPTFRYSRCRVVYSYLRGCREITRFLSSFYSRHSPCVVRISATVGLADFSINIGS